MSKSKKKKRLKNFIKSVLFIGVCLLLGFFLGIIMAKFLPTGNKDGAKLSVGRLIINLLEGFIIFYIVFILHVIIHEGGHLIFGLLTGYKFTSFRVASLLIKNHNGKISISKYKIPGTAGQCIMAPPKMHDGKVPYVLYNLGGAMMNLVSVLVIIPFIIILINNDISNRLTGSLIIFSLIGTILALTNAIPIKASVPNDGYNILSIKKDKDALKSFYYQLVIHNKVLFDTSLGELNVDEFKIREGANLVNPINTNILLMEVSYYIARFEFDQAKTTIERLLPYEEELPLIFKNEIDMEYTFLELMGEGNREIIEERFTKKLVKACSALKNMLDKQRILLAYEALYNDDIEKALKIKEDMIKNASKYPFQGQVEVELATADKVIERYYARTELVAE